MTPPFPGLTEVPKPLTRTGFRRLTFWVVVDVLFILLGLFVLVSPGHPVSLYALWLFLVVGFSVVLNLEIRLAIWKLERVA